MIRQPVAFLAICCAALVAAGQSTAPATRPDSTPWEITAGNGFQIAIPRGWRDSPALTAGRLVLYRGGDGIGVPALDETGSPLQIGLTVEKFPNQPGTIKEGIDQLTAAAKRQPTLELVGKETVETVKLADGSEAMILITEFIKERTRHSLQMKMLFKDNAGNGWVVSAFLVGGKDSKWPTKESALALWLRAHVESFILTGKVDEAKVKAAYEKRAAAGDAVP